MVYYQSRLEGISFYKEAASCQSIQNNGIVIIQKSTLCSTFKDIRLEKTE